MSRQHDTHTFDMFGDAPTANAHPALSSTPELLALCERWVARGWLRDLDRALVRFLASEAPDAPTLLLLAAALASHQLGRGHVCLDINATLNAPDFALSLPPEGDDLTDPPPLPSDVLATLTLSEWQAALHHPLLTSEGPGNTPLVVVTTHSANGTPNTRLYLRRYWQYEQSLHQHIAARLEATGTENQGERLNHLTTEPTTSHTASTGSESKGGRPIHWATGDASHPGLLPQALNILFKQSSGLDWQKTACALAARSRFGIITGGPGTGKTTTVVRLLALLQTLQLAQHPSQPLRIRLAAPTGKAAARLNESIAGQVAKLPFTDLTTLLQGAKREEAEGDKAMQDEALSEGALKEKALWEAASAAVRRLDDDSATKQLKATIPTEVTTLHRLLGARPDTRHFRHSAANPLALDVLVIDEASMVDIEMMAATLSALPAHAQCILLGDKDQLASVEAGSVLGDLCRRAEAAHYTPATADWLAQATGQPLPAEFIDPAGQPLDQAITMLRVSHRFNEHSGIGQLAKAINQPGHAQSEREKQQAVTAVLRHGYPDIHHLVMNDDAALDKLVIHGSPNGFAGNGEGRTDHQSQPIAPPTGYRHYLNVLHAQRPRGEPFEENPAIYNAWASEVLSAYSHFQLLCALRKGPWGVEGLNQRIASTLRREKLLFGSDYTLEKGWYEGRPVLVTQNDYGLKLMNGDIGITLAVPDPRNPQQKLLRVAFPTSDTDKPIRWVLPSRLHAVETVFAMTVHKSQGSEFLHTALLLPPTLNPILTRELVYTGITRAREWLTVVEAKRGVLNEAVVREVVRVSGVGEETC
ncbi:RecBCD enzyme subunit RecD [Vreelandella aquamarina]|uniref:RecBCD enzyme subunit RecD n=1 Tax=Vreelandella aquamarina TaxID=77097 RepID=A0A1N6CSL5_9GAMM|nr:exodeoxyribonuclease V subunit alpha [Halomonas meridiana]GED46800.1 RecBCD enzyme subunit RecD [Halomonas meridiana]SIN61541.1 DNA helicase/exodeoxyribonuclease V, alpha subunit [Halomonas meridiana]SIN66994.1 DNA helicase/exodeoxyribonuclease V, alpha subunit [Halomonas meridiana]SIN96434.1 DNA helicase/exodeoxyribonuclease V, alpha subunit [Halomonas meridiana]